MINRPQSALPPPPRQLLLLFLLLLQLGISSGGPISLQLYHTSPSSTLTTTTIADASSGSDPYKALAALATASLLRARHLKNRTTSHPNNQFKPEAAARSQAPLSPHAYGAYTVAMALGTPPQPVPLVFDTGSDLSWVPCTSSYTCSDCLDQDNTTARVFLPRASSTARLVGCRNPKCAWIHTPQTLNRRCPNCSAAASNCSSTQPQVCPAYLILYGSGSTGGILLSETLHISDGDTSPSGASPSTSTPDFAVGCSVFSTHQPPAGIAAFGRGPASFASQLRLSSFSYCLASRRYDDVPGMAGSLVLNGDLHDQDDGQPGNAAGDQPHQHPPARWSSTRFVDNLAAADTSSDQRNPFTVYYYVGIRQIDVAGRKLKVPQELLVPGPQGDGGAIIDSGSTFTYMEPAIMRLVTSAFEAAVAGRYNRSHDAEMRTGLRLCFEVPSSARALRFPALELRFKGGATMALPLENYFAIVASGDRSPAKSALCLMVVSDDDDAGAGVAGNQPRSGPSIILGAFQQQNYRMVFDLTKKRLHFRSQRCLTGA